jgi:protein TonB
VPVRTLTSIKQVDYSLPPPAYPQGETREGSVKIELLVGADGKVKDVTVLESTPKGVFDAVTRTAAMQWRVKPAMQDGHPIEGRVRTQVDFRMDDPAAASAPAAAKKG